MINKFQKNIIISLFFGLSKIELRDNQYYLIKETGITKFKSLLEIKNKINCELFVNDKKCRLVVLLNNNFFIDNFIYRDSKKLPKWFPRYLKNEQIIYYLHLVNNRKLNKKNYLETNLDIKYVNQMSIELKKNNLSGEIKKFNRNKQYLICLDNFI